MNNLLFKYLLLIICFTVSLIISTIAVRKGIPCLKKTATANKSAALFRDIGFWIGFFEHVIIFVMVLHKEFSALAIIFGAKELVRKDDIKENPAYYLLGTLINFGVALVMAGILNEILNHFICKST